MKRIIQCNSKTPYETKDAALVALNYLKRQGLILKVYKCPMCGKYHLTEVKK